MNVSSDQSIKDIKSTKQMQICYDSCNGDVFIILSLSEYAWKQNNSQHNVIF